MATMLNPNAIPDGSITQEKIDPSVLAGKQSTLTDTDGSYGQRVANLEKEGIASQEKLTELEGEKITGSVKIGDLVEDHMRLIRVERFGVRIWNAPQMVYYGKVCKKDGTQMKREKEVCVIQSNIKKINGVFYQCHQPSKLKT